MMRTLKRTLSIVLAIAMVLTTFGMVTVSAAGYADTAGHWAEGVIDKWSGYGVIQGDGGYFRPDDSITRAEVAQVTQNVIGYAATTANTFTDVDPNAWYADAILRLAEAGTLKGNGDGTMRPDAYMTREEAMTMLGRAYGLTPANTNAGITQYADYQSVSEYANGYIGAMTAAGYVNGYEDGTIRPQASISRGEFVKILDNMIGLYITAPGTYGPAYVKGLVMIKSGGVNLNGIVASGVVISPSAGGQLTLTNSQIDNNIYNLSSTMTVNSVGSNTTTSGTNGSTIYGGPMGSSSSRSCTVNFYVDGEFYKSVKVSYNSYISDLPDEPEKDGYIFAGWYTSEAYADKASDLGLFDFGNRRITSGLKVYAGFVVDPNATPDPNATEAPSTEAPTATPSVSLKDPTQEYNPEAPADVKAELVPADGEDVTVNGVVWEGTDEAGQSITLEEGKDYEIEGNNVVFKEEFLDSLYDGTHKVVIETSGGTVQFDIVVNGSSIPVPTEAPATEAPTVDPNATEAPSTEAPTVDPNVTEAPSTEAPTADPSVTEAPSTEAPTADPSVTEAPSTEAPTADPSVTEAPSTEAPSTEAPTVDPNATEAPATPTPGVQDVYHKATLKVTGGTGSLTGEGVKEATAPAAEAAADLPADEAWTSADAELDAMVVASKSEVAFGPYKDLNGYGEWVKGGKALTYTHEGNGQTYNFDHGWQAGAGNKTKRCFYFTPKQACIVTVAYTASAGRPMYIYQGGELLASGEDGATTDGKPAIISADIEDPTAGDVYVYGGSSNKQLYGIFADYYDPTVVVYQTLSGTINYTGSQTGLKVRFTDTKDQTTYDVDLNAGAYSVDLRQNRNYTISIVDADGKVSNTTAVTLDSNSVSIAKVPKTQDINVVDIAETEVKGDVVVHEITNNDGKSLDLSQVSLKFTAKDDENLAYTVEAGSIVDNKYTVTMMPNHEYTVTAEGIEGYELSPMSGSYLMAAGDMEPFKNILITETLGEVAVPADKTVRVGEDKEYATISDALAAVKAMKRDSGESGRITIEIDPGNYTEQVRVNSGYVTLKAADEANPPEINWYYGIGYIYYSAGPDQYYSEDCAVAKTAKKPVTRWGCAVRIEQPYVLMENIKVIDTFNCRVVPEEIADGVEAAGPGIYGDVSGKPDRTVEGYDAMKKDATERAAAIAIDANNFEAYKCEFVSSQDTFYTNTANSYIKDCYIEGGTDYIYGGKQIVFDGCTLAWHGYSDQANGGYLTACSDDGVSLGYLFTNCTVTNSKYFPDNKFSAGGWGRNWGGASCHVVYESMKLDGVDLPGPWVKMGGELSESTLYILKVTDKDGNELDVSGTNFNPNGTAEANNYTVHPAYDYFGSWTPPHYDGPAKPTPTPRPEGVIDVNLDFTNTDLYTGTAQKSPLSEATIAELAEQGVTLDAGTMYWNEHGCNGLGTITIDAKGPYKVTIGACSFGADSVQLLNGEEVIDSAPLKSAGDGAQVVMYYGGTEKTPITVKFSSASYVHSFAVQTVDPSEVPDPSTKAKITYALGDSEAQGELPLETTVDVGTKVNIPIYGKLYKEGYTLTGWTPDGGATEYKVGAEFEATGNMELTPVFVQNAEGAVPVGDVVVDFQKNNGAPAIAWEGGENVYVVQGKTADGTPIDVLITVVTNPGKLNNGNWNDCAQCNEGTTFGFPTVDNTVVTMNKIYDGTNGTYTINGVDKVGNEQSETITGKTSSTIVVKNIGGYISYFTISYPAEAPKPSEEPGAVTAEYEILEGSEVTINATPDTEGQTPVIEITGADGTPINLAVTDGKFTMPNNDIIVNVGFSSEPAASSEPGPAVTDEPTATDEPAATDEPTSTDEPDTPPVPGEIELAWEQGQAKSDSTDGEHFIVDKEGKTGVHQVGRNIYAVLPEAISAGKFTFETDVYLGPSEPGFRIQVENAAGTNYQNDNPGVIAQNIVATGSSTPVTSVTETGWYHATVVIDYTSGSPVITGTLTAPSGEKLMDNVQATIENVADTAVKQIRLISRGTTGESDSYFADPILKAE